MIEDPQVGVFPDGDARAGGWYHPLAGKIRSFRILWNRNIFTKSHRAHGPAGYHDYRILYGLRPGSDNRGRADQHLYIGSLAGAEQEHSCNCGHEFEHEKSQYRMRDC